jgi:hypothetical protein
VAVHGGWSGIPGILNRLFRIEEVGEGCRVSFEEDHDKGGILGSEEGADAADYELMFGGCGDVVVGSYQNIFLCGSGVEGAM